MPCPDVRWINGKGSGGRKIKNKWVRYIDVCKMEKGKRRWQKGLHTIWPGCQPRIS